MACSLLQSASARSHPSAPGASARSQSSGVQPGGSTTDTNAPSSSSRAARRAIASRPAASASGQRVTARSARGCQSTVCSAWLPPHQLTTTRSGNSCAAASAAFSPSVISTSDQIRRSSSGRRYRGRGAGQSERKGSRREGKCQRPSSQVRCTNALRERPPWLRSKRCTQNSWAPWALR